MTYDLTQPPRSRVISVDVRCLECLAPAYSPLDNNHIYSILVSTFILGGGDGYTMLRDETLTRERFSKCMIVVFNSF